MNFRSPRFALIIFALTLFIIIVFTAFSFHRLNRDLEVRLSEKQLQPSLEFYSAPEMFFKGQKLRPQQIRNTMERLGYRERTLENKLYPGDWAQGSVGQCAQTFNTLPTDSIFSESVESCFVLFKKNQPPSQPVVLSVSSDGIIHSLYEIDGTEQIVLEMEPELFAQFYENEPILRQLVELGDTPPLCLNALLAIEDESFLDHKGISFKGILRAVVRNVMEGRYAEGGSTITQQLVKNYFLTHKKTLKRKLKEIIMAVLLETHSSKDNILEAYINEIYMGQNGVFQVRGYGAAAQFYTGKKLTDLDLAECALLAAIINNPGRYNPSTHADNARLRRDKVLSHMLELGLITSEEETAAKTAPLPKPPERVLSEPAPYFVDAVQRQIQTLGLPTEEGLKIFTTLDLYAQETAQNTVKQGLEKLESWYKSLTQLKSEGKTLQGALVSSDPTNGFVKAVVGGREFKKSQFNRILQAQRQVGSIMKPFVYLTALETRDETGAPYTPLTLVEDRRFSTNYDNQSWSPENFGNKYYGAVPLYFALKNSLNSATAALGIRVGLEAIVDVAKRLGVQSTIKPFPSITLGAFELHPWEVLQAYNAIARFGATTPLTFIQRVEDIHGFILYEHEVHREQVIAPETAAVLIGMMKQTLDSGTGRFARTLGFNYPAAGKTGTTTEEKDAWFAGFTPLHSAVVWVGYDDNTSHGLTGATGAIPIWTEYMKQYASRFPPIDFSWPEGTYVKEIDVEAQQALGIPHSPDDPLQPFSLIFRE